MMHITNVPHNSAPFISGANHSISNQALPELTLNGRAAQIATGLHELNVKLSSLRGSIFGDGEEKAASSAPQTNTLAGYLFDAESLLKSAHGQLSSILNRL